MTDKNQASPALTNAIAWAALMIATALIMADAGDKQKMLLLLLQIVGWFSVNRALAKGGNSLKDEWTCLRQRFGGTKQD